MYPLQKSTTSIGRKQCDILLDDLGASSHHAEIQRRGSEYYFVDTKSTNGSYLNRRKVEESLLVDQDVIEIGSTTLCFFEDIRSFHGQAEEVTMSGRFKLPTETGLHDKMTVSKTISQVRIRLKIEKGEAKRKEFEFQKAHIMVGRGNVDVPLLDLDASRSHAMLEVLSAKNVYLRDMNSTNGTFVNGKKISHTKVNPGDELQIGETVFKFQFVNEEDRGTK